MLVWPHFVSTVRAIKNLLKYYNKEFYTEHKEKKSSKLVQKLTFYIQKQKTLFLAPWNLLFLQQISDQKKNTAKDHKMNIPTTFGYQLTQWFQRRRLKWKRLRTTIDPKVITILHMTLWVTYAKEIAFQLFYSICTYLQEIILTNFLLKIQL